MNSDKGYRIDFRDAEYMYTLADRRVYFPKADAYKGVIKKAYEEVSKRGNRMFVVELDIKEGAFNDFFQKLYETKLKYQKGTPFWELKLYILLEGSDWSNNLLRAFLMNVEIDNPGYIWDWDDENNIESLLGKTCCFTVEYEFVFDKTIGTYRKSIRVGTVINETALKNGDYIIQTPVDPREKDKVKYKPEYKIQDDR